MKRIITSSLLILSINMMFAQGGIQFMGGIVQLENRDEFITPDGSAQKGYFLGADAALNDGKMFLILGGQYHNISFIPNEDSSYFTHEESMDWFKIRAGLGFELIRLAKEIKIRAKTIGSINVLSQYPEDLLPEPYNKFNSGTAGIAVGLNLEFLNFGLGAEYEKGFFKAVNKMPGTEFDFYSVFLSVRI